MRLKLPRIATWPKRRWRTGGFGIHSPFAYKFITHVAKNRIAVSADTIARVGHISLSRGQARIVCRCVEYFKPSEVSFVAPDVVMLVVDNPSQEGNSNVEVTIHFGINRKESRARWRKANMITSGMDFSDGRTGIICPFPYLPRQSFKIVFR